MHSLLGASSVDILCISIAKSYHELSVLFTTVNRVICNFKYNHIRQPILETPEAIQKTPH